MELVVPLDQNGTFWCVVEVNPAWHFSFKDSPAITVVPSVVSEDTTYVFNETRGIIFTKYINHSDSSHTSASILTIQGSEQNNGTLIRCDKNNHGITTAGEMEVELQVYG